MSEAKTVVEIDTDIEENDMMKKIKEMFGKGSIEEDEEKIEPRDPLEEAVERALYSLNEIHIFAEYGRTAEAGREAKEALDAITALKQKWDEQNAIMDALSRPVNGVSRDEENF